MEIIKIDNFVSNDEYANNKITTFDNNKLVIKGDTGIGGTTAVLNVTDKNIIIISPLTGMITGKEKKRASHQMFIYKDSKDRWRDYKNDLKAGYNIILNTTPDQINWLKKNDKDLFKMVMEIPFFVDEFQVYSESHYRKMMPFFYDILFNEHKGNFILSTATPTYKNLDIPFHIIQDMEIIKIEPKIKRVKVISISKRDNYWEFIKSNCEKGIKVVLFTNDINKISNIIIEDNLAYKTQILVGEALAIKTSRVKSKTGDEYFQLKESEVNEYADIYILSTRYLIGFDLDFDASIAIIMDGHSIVDKFNVNQTVQAYGRIRKRVLEAKIFYNYLNENNEEIGLKELENDIKKLPFDSNYLTNIQPIIKKINLSFSYPKPNLIKSLQDYGFNVAVDDDTYKLESKSTTFPMMYKNLVNQESHILKNQLISIYNQIKGDDPLVNGYASQDLLLWATAYMAVETGSNYLLNASAERYERLLLTAKTFIDVNDLAYPDQMSELDKITRNRVSITAMDIAKRAGAVCQLYDYYLNIFGSSDMNKIDSINRDYGKTTSYTAFNISTDNPFSKAKKIINSLYTIYLVEKENLDVHTKRITHGLSVVSKCIIEDYVGALSNISNQNVQKLLDDDDKDKLKILTDNYSKKLKGYKIFNNTNRKIVAGLEKLKGQGLYGDTEFKQIMDFAGKTKKSLIECKQGIRNTIKVNTYSIEMQKKRHKYYVLSLLSLSCAGHMFGFKSLSIDNRIFNTLTKTTRQLRPYTPYLMQECDIRSAFPSFLDTIVGSNICQMVYKNLEVKYNIDRPEAKIRYNVMLNDFERNPLEAKEFFRDCGYTTEQVKKIVELTTKEKGSFYREMTKMEENLIFDFKLTNRLGNTAVRLHDAVIMYDTPDNQDLVTEFGNYKFEVKKL